MIEIKYEVVLSVKDYMKLSRKVVPFLFFYPYVSAGSPKGLDHPKGSRTVAVKVFLNTLAALTAT